MSVVVAVKDKDCVWMGCDDQVTLYNMKVSLGSQKKMWKAPDNKEIVMGLVGTVRDINILSTAEKWIDELTILKDEFNLKYMIRNVVPKIFSELESQGSLMIDKGVKSMESNVMFAYKDQCYAVYSDGCVLEVQDVHALGSGLVLSTGALNVLKSKNLEPKELLIEAVKSACQTDLYVNYPIYITSTKMEGIETIEK